MDTFNTMAERKMDTFKITKNFENELKSLFYGVLNEFFEEKNKEWRTERDLNSRSGYPDAPLAGVWFQPLTHLSIKK